MSVYRVNPNDLIAMIKQGYNPQQLMLSILEGQMGNTPIGQNLLNLARAGRTDEIERVVRNLAAQQGLDYDKEFNAFRKSLGL